MNEYAFVRHIVRDLTFGPHVIRPRVRKSCEIVSGNEESCENCNFYLNNTKLQKTLRASLGKGMHITAKKLE